MTDKPRRKDEMTDAQKLKRANDAVRLGQLLKAGERLMEESPLFRARIRAAAKK